MGIAIGIVTAVVVSGGLYALSWFVDRKRKRAKRMREMELTYRDTMPADLRILAEDVNLILSSDTPYLPDVERTILEACTLLSDLQEAKLEMQA